MEDPFPSDKQVNNKLAQKLTKAGIESLTDLMNMGSEQAFVELLTINPNTKLKTLFELERLVQQPYRDEISIRRKKELEYFYKMSKSERLVF